MNRDLPPMPEVRTWFAGLSRGIVAAVLALLLGLASWSPAQADELDERKTELQREMARQSAAINDAQAQRDSAVEAARAARTQLADAEAELAKAESAVRAAEELDRQRADELKAAEAALEQADEDLYQAGRDLDRAKADVAAARAALDSVNRRLNEEILVTTQHSTGLVNLALIFTDMDASNINQRAQMAHTLFDSSAQQLDEIEMRRLSLEDAEARAGEARQAADAAQQAADEAKDAADAARRSAAEQLKGKKAAQGAAEDLRSEVAGLVAARDKAEEKARKQVAAEEQRQRELEAENADVEKRIQQRIEAEKKAAAEKAAREAAAKAAAEKAAKEKAAREAAAKAAAEKAAADKAAADKAAAAKAAAAAKPAPAPKPQAAAAPKKASKAAASASSSSRSNSVFIRPVEGRLTSKFGMRLHPVLGYRKLHDGTDFGAACGAPIRAAADGVVTERYFNRGYGHRLMIDHGKVAGSYVTTGYNHATHYIVSVGTRVKQGQVVGYVGSTGYSTGCHLHLMVWQNGKVVNPMAGWFS